MVEKNIERRALFFGDPPIRVSTPSCWSLLMMMGVGLRAGI
jgi:hypothetical protein